MSTIEVEREAHEVVGLAMTGTLMTPEEFDAIEEWDEEYVYELIHGVLVVSPSPLPVERGPNEELAFMLTLYQRQHPEGAALLGTLPEHTVRLPDSRRRADRAIWVGPAEMPNPILATPSILVEFASAGKRSRLRDYIEKRAEYLTFGVREYWIFDRFRRRLTVYRADGSEIVIPPDGVYRTDLLPGFELPVAQILESADRWAKLTGR